MEIGRKERQQHQKRNILVVGDSMPPEISAKGLSKKLVVSAKK